MMEQTESLTFYDNQEIYFFLYKHTLFFFAEAKHV